MEIELVSEITEIETIAAVTSTGVYGDCVKRVFADIPFDKTLAPLNVASMIVGRRAQ